jgi:hypothetical protein
MRNIFFDSIVQLRPERSYLYHFTSVCKNDNMFKCVLFSSPLYPHDYGSYFAQHDYLVSFTV